jgi:hypothetical protein
VLPEQARSPRPLPDGRADARLPGGAASAWARFLFRMILAAGRGRRPARAATAAGAAHPVPTPAVAAFYPAFCPAGRDLNYAVTVPLSG